jgi:hypothetical protein
VSLLLPGVPVSDVHDAVYDVIGKPLSSGGATETRIR